MSTHRKHSSSGNSSSGSKHQAKAESVAGSAKTDGFSLKNEIVALSATQCSMKEQAGFFMTTDQLRTLEDRLHVLMVSGATSMSPTGLLVLQDQLNEMTSRAQKAEIQLAATERKAESINLDLKSAKDAFDAQNKASQMALKDINKEKFDLKASLKELQDKQRAAAKTSSDPEVVAERAKLITKLQNELAAMNATYALEQSKTRSLKSQVEMLENEVKVVAAQKKRYTSAIIVDDDAPLTVLDPIAYDEVLDGAVLKKVFSNETLNLLNEAAAVRRSNIREYAHKLLELAGRTDPKNFVGYKDYMNVVFNKVKGTTAKARARYLPALDGVYRSMAAKGGPKLKEVKNEFSELFGKNPEAEKKTREKVKTGKYSWWDALKFDIKYYRMQSQLRWSIFKKEAKAFITSIPLSLKSWWLSIF